VSQLWLVVDSLVVIYAVNTFDKIARGGQHWNTGASSTALHQELCSEAESDLGPSLPLRATGYLSPSVGVGTLGRWYRLCALQNVIIAAIIGSSNAVFPAGQW